jgi:hypothetical protein
MNTNPTTACGQSPASDSKLTSEERQVIERIKRHARPSRNQGFTRWLLSVHCGFHGW